MLKIRLEKIFQWFDENRTKPVGRLANQLAPVTICIVLFVIFMGSSWLFIQYLINPSSDEKIALSLHLEDITVGFFLYFVTAVDYALIVGRMQASNPGFKARVIMNIATCIGCFMGVSLVLFMWAFAKEVDLVIILLLIFAGSVMLKLAYEGIEYFDQAKSIPLMIRKATSTTLEIGYKLTSIFTFWIPELAKPKTEKLSPMKIAKWSLLLPFIIGLDDMIGYMGAMTIYNVFGLLFGIYVADMLIDILIFVAPELTEKVVKSALLSLLASFAFLYLAYKAYKESFTILHENVDASVLVIFLVFFIALVIFAIGKKFLTK